MELSFNECLSLYYSDCDLSDDALVTVKFKNGGEIIQDKGVDCQYIISRKLVHDGTLAFTQDLVCSAMSPLLQQVSIEKGYEPKEGEVPHYTIGKIELNQITEYDKPEHMKWPTVCEEITIPVKVEWRNLLGGMPLLHGVAQY